MQFKLPNSYSSYDSQDDFIDYYPFVPYQFKLIMQVFNSFLNLGYVAKEVKGNERSIIKVIHSTAKANADAELGKFISFDELYNNMFEEGLQARGRKLWTMPFVWHAPTRQINRKRLVWRFVWPMCYS